MKMQPKPEQAKEPVNQETANVDLSAVLAHMAKQDALIAELQAQANPENAIKKAKTRYEGPRNYSHKLWADKPVLSYKSVKKDLTKDFTYKNHLQVLTNNQDLELTFIGGETLRVDVHEFNNNFTRSEKLPAEPVTDGVSVTGYRFNTPEFGEFVVSANLIN